MTGELPLKREYFLLNSLGMSQQSSAFVSQNETINSSLKKLFSN